MFTQLSWIRPWWQVNIYLYSFIYFRLFCLWYFFTHNICLDVHSFPMKESLVHLSLHWSLKKNLWQYWPRRIHCIQLSSKMVNFAAPVCNISNLKPNFYAHQMVCAQISRPCLFGFNQILMSNYLGRGAGKELDCLCLSINVYDLTARVTISPRLDCAKCHRHVYEWLKCSEF